LVAGAEDRAQPAANSSTSNAPPTHRKYCRSGIRESTEPRARIDRTDLVLTGPSSAAEVPAERSGTARRLFGLMWMACLASASRPTAAVEGARVWPRYGRAC